MDRAEKGASKQPLSIEQKLIAQGFSEAWSVLMDIGVQRGAPSNELSAFSTAIQKLSDDLPSKEEMSPYMRYDVPLGGFIARVVIELGEVTDEVAIRSLQKRFSPALPDLSSEFWDQAVERAKKRSEGQI